MTTNITEETRLNMQEKLACAERSLTRMTKAITDDPISVQDHFWSFLHAIHLIWFYFGFWVKNSGQMKNSKQLIEKWKACRLPEEDQCVWNTLGNLRDEDAHVKPVVAKTPKGSRPLFDDKTGRPLFSDKSGKMLCSESKPFRVIQDGKEHGLLTLCQNGLAVFQKFVSEFDRIE